MNVNENVNEIANGLKAMRKESRTLAIIFQKYRPCVIAFVISMPINCVILQVEV